ncbi:MAG: hypothetical protein GEU83_06790 [Pseudonocardiaceae bacterium]|nr:hypothetical protein [Pseudonocardiaceae bacterium]
MGDLYVRSDVLDGLQSRWWTVPAQLSGACTSLRRIDGAVVGASPLINAMDDFAEGWQHGISQIGERTERAVQALTQIGKAFDECDTALGEACRPDGGSGAGGGADDAA